MPVESLSPHHLSTDVRGHAHPPPAPKAMTADTKENQHLTELLAKVAFDVEIRGLAVSSDAPAYEMYHPRLRKSDVTQQAISHLDTVSCWRGISYSQALELTLWERLFHCCLVSRIEDRLQQTIVTQLNKRKGCIDEKTFLPCLIQTFSKDSLCLLDINFSCLFRDMTDAFCDHHHSQITARNLPWSFGSGDLPRFVYNFLSTQDCFQNTPAGPCVFINCSIDWFTFPLIAVTASVAWHPPAIEFQHVPAQIKSRAHYVIVPCRRRIVEDLQQPEYKQYPDFVEYTVKKSSSKIQWDHIAELFRAQAPERVGINDAAVSETILQVKIITRFPGSVRFESTSRYTVKVNLMDTGELGTATDNNHSRNSSLVAPCTLPRRRSYPFEPSFCQQMEQVVRATGRVWPTFFPDSLNELTAHRIPPYSSEQFHGKEPTDTDDRVSPIHSECYPYSEVSGKSTKKRSNSLYESEMPSPEGNRLHDSYKPGPNTELKRQKLEQTDVTEMEAVLSRQDNAMGVQCPTPPYTPLTSNANHFDHRARFTSSTDMRASPACHARTDFKFSPQLSQQTIQRNYQEFEKMALRKLIDEPCLGDVSFENIFLSDSEAADWHSSDLEGLSDEVNSMETEL